MAWTILVVDDSRTIQEAVRMTFINTEFNVIAALDAEEGLKQAKALSPNLILVDLRLPFMGGFEFCREIKSQPETNRIPVLLFVGQQVEIDQVQSKAVGAQGHFYKPFATQDLIDQATMICQAAPVEVKVETKPEPEAAVLQDAEPMLEAEAVEEEELVIEAEEVVPEAEVELEELVEADVQAEPIAELEGEDVLLEVDVEPEEAEPILEAELEEEPEPQIEAEPLATDQLGGGLEDFVEAEPLDQEVSEAEIDADDMLDDDWFGEDQGVISTDAVVAQAQQEQVGSQQSEDDARASQPDPEMMRTSFDGGFGAQLRQDAQQAASMPEEEEAQAPVQVSDEMAASLLVEIGADDDEDIAEAEAVDNIDEAVAVADMVDADAIMDEFELAEDETTQPATDESVQELEQAELDRLRRMPLNEPEPVQQQQAEQKEMDPFGLGFEMSEDEVQEAEAAEELDMEELDFDVEAEPLEPLEEEELEPVEEDLEELLLEEEPASAEEDQLFELEDGVALEEVQDEAEVEEPQVEPELEAEPEAELEAEPEVEIELTVESEEGVVTTETFVADESEELEAIEPADIGTEEADVVSLAAVAAEEAVLDEPAEEEEAVEPVSAPEEEFVVEHKEGVEAPLSAGEGLPSPEQILALFKTAVREEISVGLGELKDSLREMLREEVKAAVAEEVRQMQPAQIDEERLAQLVSRNQPEPVEQAPAAVDTEALAALVREQLEQTLPELLESQPKPAAVPSSGDVALAVAQVLKQPLADILDLLSTPPSEEKEDLGEEIHTWISSAMSELPSAEEVGQIVSQAMQVVSPAAGSTAAPSVPDNVADAVRNAVREEMGQLIGQQTEAIAWEVVPELAEIIIKKELDRLTADRV